MFFQNTSSIHTLQWWSVICVVMISRCHVESKRRCVQGERERCPLVQSGLLSGAHSCTALTHTGGRAAVRHTPQRLSGAGAHLETLTAEVEEVLAVAWTQRGFLFFFFFFFLYIYMHSSFGWGSRCVVSFEDCTPRCRSFWWVYSGSGASTSRKPRWTCSRWAPSSRWSGSSSDSSWTARASSSTAACASFTAGSKRRRNTRTNWKSSSSRRIRTRNTGRTFCSRCHGPRYLSKTDTKR